ncbi:U3 small nucleolar RNA-associated protein 25 [Colletotrichum aenigma]|uniref:U3 small nucleolar RNA-associated protein 25 n=1 Tax=Colletotrichum aenigma TaxID=1215731 RepID=UPI001872FB0D|nr:U3 small nucleolar RNA-associated protein 25 [Colletotrichum aenigma]KAF5507101.1 U3 small nucleolar RNA-associated protein 25 [Colletotrichum aenigma]
MGARGRGRAGFRGGGRGGARGRGGRGGRGRGRGGGPGRSRFNTARLEENESSGSESGEEMDSEVEEDSDVSMSDDEEDEDVDEQPQNSRPYMALLQGFTESTEPSAKRRKLDSGKPESAAKATAAAEESSEDEDEDEEAGEKDVDRVDEAEEEDPSADLADEEAESDDEDDVDATDPFDNHFATPDEDTYTKKVKAIQKNGWTFKRSMSKVSKAVVTYPQFEGSEAPSIPSPISSLESLKLKQKLKESASKKISPLNTLQQAMAPVLFNYNDVLYDDRDIKNSEGLRQLVCLHAVNHVFKTRDRVIKNNYKLAKEENADLELRDQGFTRPKVLFILPTRQSCLKMVNTIEALCAPDQRENRKRFEEAYTDEEVKFGNDKPEDFRDLFEGNDDDMFRIGMKFTRKTIKYFSQFYNSDILFASPLGLRMAIGSEEDKKKMDYDFLSSIELVVVDQADAQLMQNWEHVEYIFEHMNLQPKDAHGCDFSRVRSWYLEDWSKYFRQTVILSAFNTPELTELFRTQCHNWAGKIRFQADYSGVLQQLGLKARQTFSRFEAKSIDKEPDARFDYFVSAILPSLIKRAKDTSGTLIFIPSYLDFVRVRNYFATNAAVGVLSFGTISEYSEVPEVSRARSHFTTGRHKVLLYTERAHHFRRYNLRGVQRVIMYGLPDNPIFYREIAGGYLAHSEQNLLIEPGQGTIRAMFSKYDVMRLERIVGTQRVGKMIQEKGDTFDFV